MHPRTAKLATALAAALAFLIVAPARADLARVGPVNGSNGFPTWYQDQTGTVVDLCLPDGSDPGGLQTAACLLTNPPPITFPDTFPDEAFYFNATSTPIATTAGKRALLVLALEAAFGTGPVVPGQQIVFARIRVTAGVPFNGTYTVKHPYGTETFPDVVAGQGNHDIFFTEDIGLAPGDFTGALTGRVGPFLQHAASPGGAPLPPVTINGSQFLSDGAATEFVTGSPFGTNYFEICGPFDGPDAPERCIREETFTLSGKLHDSARSPIGSPLKVDRATYSRSADDTTRVDIAATAAAGIGQAAPKLTVGAANIAPVLMAGPDALGRFYAQSVLPAGGEVPNDVTVINSGDSPPSKETAHVVDEVTVRSATYDAAGQVLTVVATSSDKSSQHGPGAELAIDGFGGATRQKLNADDPVETTLTASGVTVPPARVRVISTKGGSARSGVSIGTLNQTFGAGVPLALDDANTATQGGPAVVIPVTLNDVANPANPITGVSVLAPGPDSGTAVANPDGTITYTPGANVGPVTFRYTASSALGTSNIATVTVDVVAGQAGPTPTANPDPTAGVINVTAGTASSIDVLANDNGNGATLNPASVTITTPPASGTAVVDPATGKITFTAGPAAGVVTFAYTVANTNAQVSPPATVTVTVVAPEDLQIQTAKCQRSSNTWDIRGTSTISDGNSVQLFLTGTVPAAPTASQLLGSPLPVTAGAWRLQLKNGPSCRTPISALSALGTKRENVAVQLN
jgi:Bacterial Ig domain